MELHLTAVVLCLCVFGVRGQENAGKSVAVSLLECYNNSVTLNPNNRLPSSMNVLIELIRKVENSRTTQDARQLSIEIIHRFRQDGIEHTGALGSEFTLPFSPVRNEAERNRILLRRLIPGTAVNFPNQTLTLNERCSLHFMMSSTFNMTIRGDEGNVCNRLGRYERRVERSVNSDAEVFNPENLDIMGNLEEGEIPPPEEQVDSEPEAGLPQDPNAEAESFGSGRATSTTTSTCPIEGGVVFTRWGAVKVGTVIAGIAAGLEPQLIPEGNIEVDSRFAATLVGDITEASLFQVNNNNPSVGAQGGWTSTQVPRLYYVNAQDRLEMTDTDIRAGLDGLIMARNMQAWRTRFPTIKLSQVLDMYYSRRGVFSVDHRACNRYTLLNQVAPREALVDQTTGFSIIFDRDVTIPGTILPSQMPNLSNRTVTLFLNYAPTINDPTCLTNVTIQDRIATDIIIALDTQWPNAVIHAAFSHLLDNLDINQYESSFTIINANNGQIIVNRTNSILDYHQLFNLSAQQQHPTGTQFSRIITEAEQIVRNRMDQDRVTGDIGGRSTIVLLVPHQSQVTAEDAAFVTERREIFRSFLPDIRFLVLGLGNRDTYSSLVNNVQSDVFTLTEASDGTSIVNAINPLISRIQELHRRIVNPNCGSDFVGDSSSHSFQQFIEPQTIIFYRVAPNYFHGDGDRILRITGQGDGTIIVCTSNEITHPRQNITSGNQDCRPVNANEEIFILTGACVDGLILDCPPLFFSVEAPATNPTPRCTELGCRFPDNIRYSIAVEGFVCRSSSASTLASFMLVTLMFVLSRW